MSNHDLEAERELAREWLYNFSIQINESPTAEESLAALLARVRLAEAEWWSTIPDWPEREQRIAQLKGEAQK